MSDEEEIRKEILVAIVESTNPDKPEVSDMAAARRICDAIFEALKAKGQLRTIPR